MTIIGVPSGNHSHTLDRREICGSRAAAPTGALRRRLAKFVGNAMSDRQPIESLSEQVISDIRGVHSVNR